MKTTAFTILGLVLGVVLGAGGIHQWLMPQMVDLDAQLRDREHKLASMQSGDGNNARLARLEAEREDYEKKLDELRARLESTPSTGELASAPESLDAEPALADATPEDVEEERGRRGGEDGERRGRRGGPWGDDSTPEEREARRQEFVAQMGENMTNFFTGEMEKSSTPAMKERLVELETQVYEMMELRGQMRDVEDDAERDALRQAYEESVAAASATMKAQQRDMIDAIAAQFNITNSKDQAAFQQAVRAAVKSPMFGDDPSDLFRSSMQGGGGFGGGRPGRGFGR